MTKQELIQKYNELEAEQNKIIGKIELLDEQAKEVKAEVKPEPAK